MGNCISVLMKQNSAMMILTVIPESASTAYLMDLVASMIMSIVTQMSVASEMGIATANQEAVLQEQFVDTTIF